MALNQQQIRLLILINIAYAFLLAILCGGCLYSRYIWIDSMSEFGDVRLRFVLGKSNADSVIEYLGEPDSSMVSMPWEKRIVYSLDPIQGKPGIGCFTFNESGILSGYSIAYGDLRKGRK